MNIVVNEEPSWLDKSESSSGPCLRGIDHYSNQYFKDYDSDGEYEIMYKNNLIGIELQRSLGWVDIDGDGITEIIDPTPYGGFKELDRKEEVEVTGPFTFQLIEEKMIESCRFARIVLENGMEGITPLECREFNSDIVNIYLGVKYYWKQISSDKETILIPFFKP